MSGHTDEEVRDIARAIVHEVGPEIVRQTLISIGIDPNDPISAQKDAVFVRATRERCEQAGSRAMVLLMGVILLGAVSMFWNGLIGHLKELLK